MLSKASHPRFRGKRIRAWNSPSSTPLAPEGTPHRPVMAANGRERANTRTTSRFSSFSAFNRLGCANKKHFLSAASDVKVAKAKIIIRDHNEFIYFFFSSISCALSNAGDEKLLPEWSRASTTEPRQRVHETMNHLGKINDSLEHALFSLRCGRNLNGEIKLSSCPFHSVIVLSENLGGYNYAD